MQEVMRRVAEDASIPNGDAAEAYRVRRDEVREEQGHQRSSS